MPAAQCHPDRFRERAPAGGHERPRERLRRGRYPIGQRDDRGSGGRHTHRRAGSAGSALSRRWRTGRTDHRHRHRRGRGGSGLDQGGRGGRADRQVREPADHAGDPGPGLRHPPRTDRTRRAGALSHRRRAARGHALAEVHPVRRDQPAQDHGGHQHRRTPDPTGRTPECDDQRPEGRPACGHPAHGVGGEDGPSDPRQLHSHARLWPIWGSAT